MGAAPAHAGRPLLGWTSARHPVKTAAEFSGGGAPIAPPATAGRGLCTHRLSSGQPNPDFHDPVCRVVAFSGDRRKAGRRLHHCGNRRKRISACVPCDPGFVKGKSPCVKAIYGFIPTTYASGGSGLRTGRRADGGRARGKEDTRSDDPDQGRGSWVPVAATVVERPVGRSNRSDRSDAYMTARAYRTYKKGPGPPGFAMPRKRDLRRAAPVRPGTLGPRNPQPAAPTAPWRRSCAGRAGG